MGPGSGSRALGVDCRVSGFPFSPELKSSSWIVCICTCLTSHMIQKMSYFAYTRDERSSLNTVLSAVRELEMAQRYVYIIVILCQDDKFFHN